MTAKQVLGVVAVGGSAGGVEALTNLVAGLPRDLPYAVLVALHMPLGAPSVLARILDRNGPLPAVQAIDGAPLTPGTIHVGIPNRHLLINDHRIVLSDGPTENGHRPAINALFRSAALGYAHHAIGILLSGVLDDGRLGFEAIRSRGGITIAQTPTDALFPAMPGGAIEAGLVDHEAAAKGMGRLLTELAERDIEEQTMHPDPRMELENRIARAERFSTKIDAEILGEPSGYTCPDCNGSLISVTDGNYRCHVGHAWTADALLLARDREIETALWIAMRSLQEKSKLSRRLAGEVTPGELSRRYQAVAEETEHAIAVLGDRLAEVYANKKAPDG